MIIREKTTREFTQFQNALIRDLSIPRRAKALLLELLSMPESWNLSIDYIVNTGPDGEYAVRSMVRSLEGAGYIHKVLITRLFLQFFFKKLQIIVIADM